MVKDETDFVLSMLKDSGYVLQMISILRGPFLLSPTDVGEENSKNSRVSLQKQGSSAVYERTIFSRGITEGLLMSASGF